MNDFLLLAADADQTLNSDIGLVIQTLLGALGVIILLVALFKGVPKFIEGKIGAGLKTVVGGLLVTALCFNPQLLFDLVDLVGSLLGTGTDSIEDITQNPGGGGRS